MVPQNSRTVGGGAGGPSALRDFAESARSVRSGLISAKISHADVQGQSLSTLSLPLPRSLDPAGLQTGIRESIRDLRPCNRDPNAHFCSSPSSGDIVVRSMRALHTLREPADCLVFLSARADGSSGRTGEVKSVPTRLKIS